MRSLIITMIALAAVTGGSARAEESATAYTVTYFEVTASAATATAQRLREFAAATRKEDGATLVEPLEERERPARFAMIEEWRDQKAFQTHDKAPQTAALRQALQPALVSPFDSRPHTGLTVAPLTGTPGTAAVYVLTHVDIVPTAKDEGLGLVRQLAEDGRKDAGNLLFDTLQQTSRPNHFTLFQIWADRAAFDAAVATAHTREFRQKLWPLSGSLYDERLYEALR